MVQFWDSDRLRVCLTHLSNKNGGVHIERNGSRCSVHKSWPIDPFGFKSFQREVSEKLPQE